MADGQLPVVLELATVAVFEGIQSKVAKTVSTKRIRLAIFVMTIFLL